MIMLHAFKRILWCVHLLSVLSTNTATRFVTSLLDDGSPGTLRTTIAAANSGDTILFGVSGTIFLEAANGELVIDKKLTINGEEKIAIDGGDEIAVGLHVVASGGDSTITSLTIQHFSSVVDTIESTDVYGILIDTGADNCSIQNNTIQLCSLRGGVLFSSLKNIFGVGTSIMLYGIRAQEPLAVLTGNAVAFLTTDNNVTNGIVGIAAAVEGGAFSNNSVSHCTTGDSAIGSSGSIVAIQADVKAGLFIGNTISNCTTGQSNDDSGSIIGLEATFNLSSCTNNTISGCTTGYSATGSSGDILAIEAAVEGGSFTDNTISSCTTGQSSGDSGSFMGLEATFNLSSCANNRIFDCTTGEANDESGGLVAIRGVFEQGNCSDNTVSNCSTGTAHLISGGTIAIITQIVGGDCSGNTVFNCSTGIGGNGSGGLEGIIATIIEGNCSNNTVFNCSTGTSSSTSGSTVGLQIQTLKGNCSGNSINNLSSGIALESGFIYGILFSSVLSNNETASYILKNNIDTLISGEAITRGYAQGLIVESIHGNSHISCNTIKTIHGGEEIFSVFNNTAHVREEVAFVINNTLGLKMQQGNLLTIQGNSISDIAGENGKFTTGIQLGDTDLEGFSRAVTNSIISHNSIENISDITSGFGITILSEDSRGNSLLSNSIFDTTDKAINILDNFLDGENISAFPDAIVTLTSVTCTTNGKIHVVGLVEPQMGLGGQPFLLQFFVSDTNPPSQAKTLIFEYLLDGSEGNNFDLIFTPAVSTNFGQYISATATAQVTPPAHNLNTSEVSNALPACDSASQPYSPFICPEVPTPIPPFDCNNCPFIPNSGDAFDIL